jgi:hypothetical protein
MLFGRARIVSEPTSDYIRFKYEATPGLNVAAGEEGRWLPRKLARGLNVPVNDYWVFDDRLVRFGYFTGNGTYLEGELTDDAETIRTCAEAFERVWEIAIPHANYRPAKMVVSPSSSVQRARPGTGRPHARASPGSAAERPRPARPGRLA